MFLSKSGSTPWVFKALIKRESCKLGLDAVLFSQGGILKGLDLKTCRALSEAEMAPCVAAFSLGTDTLRQIYGRGP